MQAPDMTVAYVKDEPIKAMLIAAATGALLMGADQPDRPLARLSASRTHRSRAMIHPLLRLVATEPHLLGDHVEAYAELVGEEVSKVSTAWIARVGLVRAWRCSWSGRPGPGRRRADALGGACRPTDYPAPWALVVGPAGAVRLGAVLRRLSRARSRPRSAFDTIKKQLNADMAMLREVSAS